MKKSIRILLSVLLIAVFLFSISQFWQLMQDKSYASSSYGEALALVSSGKKENNQGQSSSSMEISDEALPAGRTPEAAAVLRETDPHIQTLLDIDLDALLDVNSEVIGWILIPGTNINYPLMQGADNDEYLYHTWDHQLSSVGSIFMEHTNSPDFTDYNTIIYGHNMTDGSMFNDLQKYRHQMFWQANPYVYIRTVDNVYRFEIFSAYLADVESNTYGIEFLSDHTRADFLNIATENSVITPRRTPSTTDQFLTLSTCGGTYATRWVVQAFLDAAVEIGN